MVHTIFVDAVASLVIGLHKEFQLLSTFRMPHLLFTEHEYTQLQTILPTVIHHAVLHHTRGGGLRFHHPENVHLVVLQHQQTHTDIVYLHLIHAVFVQLHRVYHAVG